jgi:heptosyltransferase-2
LKRILVVRGGAIGDFILTLPAIKLLRDHNPNAQIEILGGKHIVALAEKRFYADGARSIEDGRLAGFFAKGPALSPELVDYFGGFDLIVSYLFDPDRIFESNLKRCGGGTFIAGPPKLGGHTHAAKQLARPLEDLGLYLEDHAARLFPTEADRESVRDFIGSGGTPFIALHPGSGSATKNWPLERWEKIGQHLLSRGRTFVVVGGEADEERIRRLESLWRNKGVRFATNLPLPQLAALLEKSFFIGHDSGISHLAAAAGAECLLLFGPTDPSVWAPANKGVRVLQSPNGNLEELEAETVIAALWAVG